MLLKYSKALVIVSSASFRSGSSRVALTVGLYFASIWAWNNICEITFYTSTSMHMTGRNMREREREKRETSSVECTWDLWVPFKSLASLSYEFASTDIILRSRFLRKRNIAETPLFLKYFTISLWCSIKPCKRYRHSRTRRDMLLIKLLIMWGLII